MRRKKEEPIPQYGCFDPYTGEFVILKDVNPYGNVTSSMSVPITKVDQNGDLVRQHTLTAKEKRKLEKEKHKAALKAEKERKKRYHSFYDDNRSYRNVGDYSAVPLYDPENDDDEDDL